MIGVFVINIIFNVTYGNEPRDRDNPSKSTSVPTCYSFSLLWRGGFTPMFSYSKWLLQYFYMHMYPPSTYRKEWWCINAEVDSVILMYKCAM